MCLVKFNARKTQLLSMCQKRIVDSSIIIFMNESLVQNFIKFFNVTVYLKIDHSMMLLFCRYTEEGVSKPVVVCCRYGSCLKCIQDAQRCPEVR